MIHRFCTSQCTVFVHFSTSLIYYKNALSESSISLEHLDILDIKVWNVRQYVNIFCKKISVRGGQ
jgi:hypothetical protein